MLPNGYEARGGWRWNLTSRPWRMQGPVQRPVQRHALERAANNRTLAGSKFDGRIAAIGPWLPPPTHCAKPSPGGRAKSLRARTYGRIGCILRLAGRANWSFGGKVSIRNYKP